MSERAPFVARPSGIAAPLPPRLVELASRSDSLEGRAARHLRRVRALPPPPADMLARVAERLDRDLGRARPAARRGRPLLPRWAWASVGLAAGTAFAFLALRPAPAPRAPGGGGEREEGTSAIFRLGRALPRLVTDPALPAGDLAGPGETSAAGAIAPVGSAERRDPRDRLLPPAGRPGGACRGFAPGEDLAVCGATYVGGPGADAPVAVEIGAGGLILVAGTFEGADFGVEPRRLLGGGDGALVAFDRTGRALVGVARLGGAVLDVEVDRSSGEIVAGVEPHGLVRLDPEASTVRWVRPHRADRVAAGSDGVTAALDARQGRVALFARTGEARGTIVLPAGVIATDVAVDGQSHTVVVTGEVPGTPAMPLLRGYGYDGIETWSAWSSTAEEARARRLTASARGARVAMGRDGKLLFAGRAQGGNSVFLTEPRDLARRLPDPGYDRFSVATNVGNESVLFVGRFGPADGTLEAAQIGLTRDDSPQKRGKSVVPIAIASDEAGHVFVAGYQTGLMEGEGRKSVRGTALRRSRRDAFALVLAPDLGRRLLWTTFGTGSPAVAAGIAVGAGVVAFAGVQERAGGAAPLVTFEPVQAKPPGGASDGYLAVWPAP
jgi:hypothetical protein